MDRLVIDASVFLSSLFKEEAHSKISVDFLQMVQGKQCMILMPMLTLFEVLHGFYRVSRDKLATEAVHESFIDMNASNGLKIFSLEASFLSHFMAYHKCFDLKTSDAIVVLTAHREKCPLISWDKQLLKVASKQIKAYTPEEYLELLA
jgi:predicted nucleic acid-binding protein